MKELQEILSFFNLLLIPIIAYIVRVEHRLTRIETHLKLNCKEKK